MKIFYSWQLDAPRKVNKDFIFNALNMAISRLSEDPDISAAERDGLGIDQDTQGVLGSPDVARVIFEKIAASNVIVTDVSLIASGKGAKPHINSNVAIELGYAYAKPGDEAVLKIMNTYFGKPDDLPFDLRTRRYPVKYHLEPGADADTIAAELKKLANQLAEILKLYLENSPGEQPVTHVEVSSTGQRGMFWQPHEPLVPASDSRRRNDVFWNGPRVLYFRCIPLNALPELSSRDAKDMTADLRPLSSEGGSSRSRNKWGASSHCVAANGDLIGLTRFLGTAKFGGSTPTIPL